MGVPSAALKPGEIVAGRYRIDGVIGSGGMGVVYSATHTGLNQRVALKMLLPGASMDGAVVARFLQEAQIAGQLTSEHVVRVTDVGKGDDNSPFLVMEHLTGSNLSELLRTRGPLPVRDVAGWIVDACEGLAEAHSKGIVHRDLKPANLFLARRANGTTVLKVLDFGISKLLPTGPLEQNEGALTATDALIGSPRYMSPEQVRSSKRVDLRTDIWSLGVTLYELTGGALPFHGESSFELLVTIVSSEPRSLGSLRSEIPRPFEQVVSRCLEKAPEKRFANAGDLAEALAPFGPGESAAMVPRIRVFSDLSPAEPPAPEAPAVSELAETEVVPPPRLASGASTGEGVTSSLSGAPAAPSPFDRRVALAVVAGVLVTLGFWRWQYGSPSPAQIAPPPPTQPPQVTSAQGGHPPPSTSVAAPSAERSAAPSEPASSTAPLASTAPGQPRPPSKPLAPTPTRNSIRDESRK